MGTKIKRQPQAEVGEA